MYYYIVNPAAGHGAINQIQDKLRARLSDYGISGEFAKTTGPGEATAMAKAAIAKGHTTIVAVGGDGTVNEVINGVAKSSAAIGIIPIGDSNVVAARLGIRSWQQAAELLAARRLASFGLIAAGQKYFLSTLTLGFETDIDKQVDTTQPALRDRLKQFGQSWGHAQNFKSLSCHIEVDDQYELDCDLFSLSVNNQKFLNPLADNRLLVSLNERPTQTQLAGQIWRKLGGRSATEESSTTRFLASRLVINTDPPTGVMIDGKTGSRTPVAIRLTDYQVRFIIEKPDAGLLPTGSISAKLGQNLKEPLGKQSPPE